MSGQQKEPRDLAPTNSATNLLNSRTLFLHTSCAYFFKPCQNISQRNGGRDEIVDITMG